MRFEFWVKFVEFVYVILEDICFEFEDGISIDVMVGVVMDEVGSEFYIGRI